MQIQRVVPVFENEKSPLSVRIVGGIMGIAMTALLAYPFAGAFAALPTYWKLVAMNQHQQQIVVADLVRK